MKSLTGIIISWLLVTTEAMNVLYEWSSVDFSYDQTKRKNDLRSGALKPEDVVILDSDAYSEGKNSIIFVTTPDLIPGTPFSLSTVSTIKSKGGFLLKPYPGPSWHKTGNCDNTITSVWRIKIDIFGRLWAIDSGKIRVFGEALTVCPPQLLLFDLKTNHLIKKYRIPSSFIGSESLFINLEVEILNNDPRKTFVYITDPGAFALIVYNFEKGTAHRIVHPYFYPTPEYGFFNVNGVNFTLMDGIFPLALGPPDRSGYKNLYFHAFSGGQEGVVRTNVLWSEQSSNNPYNFYTYPTPRGFHSSSEVVNDYGVMIFSNVEANSLMSWNIYSDYIPNNFRTVAKDEYSLQFATGMKIFKKNTLLVTTSRLQNVINQTIARNQTNYRILFGSISEMLSKVDNKP